MRDPNKIARERYASGLPKTLRARYLAEELPLAGEPHTMLGEYVSLGMVEALRDEFADGCPHLCSDGNCPHKRRITAKLAELEGEP